MLEASSITVSNGDTERLRSVSLDVRSDEFVLLVGRNGSGKTTLLDVLSGLETPDEGRVTIDGRDIHADESTRSMIGRVFEDPRDQLLGATVSADVAFGPENLGLDQTAIERRVEEALAGVGLAGMDSVSVDALSGGQRARLAIAGALAMQPRYLLLDEPTGGLDHPGRQVVLDHLRAVNADGIGIVLATHHLRDLEGDVDRVIGLDAGRTCLDAPPSTAVQGLPGLGVRVPPTWT